MEFDVHLVGLSPSRVQDDDVTRADSTGPAEPLDRGQAADPDSGAGLSKRTAFAIGFAGLLVGLLAGVMTTGESADRIELSGVLTVVDANRQGIAFTPNSAHRDLIPDGEEVVTGVLANLSDTPAEAGSSFEGYWLPDDQVLVIEAVTG